GEAPARPAEPPAPAGTVYTCPMDPEVVSDHPGSCPKCGMALEPQTPSLEEGPNPELADMSRRLWVGVALGAPIVLMAMSAVVTVLILLGQVLEIRARGQTSVAIRRLLGLAPRTARLVRDGGREEDVPLEQVRPGDVLRVRPGQKVPVDGVVTEGRSSVDES